MKIAGNGKWMGITNFFGQVVKCEVLNLTRQVFNLFQEPVEQELEFFKEVKVRLAKVLKLANTLVRGVMYVWSPLTQSRF